jgi:hypothetical protein
VRGEEELDAGTDVRQSVVSTMQQGVGGTEEGRKRRKIVRSLTQVNVHA